MVHFSGFLFLAHHHNLLTSGYLAGQGQTILKRDLIDEKIS